MTAFYPRLRFLLSPRPTVLSFLIAACVLSACRAGEDEPANPPPDDGLAVTDDRLSLSLVAEDPDVVTPIGLAIDDMDRLFVLESHTHLPPEDYAGPDWDRVLVFQDQDHDGRHESRTVFADGIDDGMNLAFGPSGALYVVTSRSVLRLEDRDGDLKADEQEVILQLTEPENPFDHAALLGITTTEDGWLYVSRGNTGGASWKLEGADGSFVEGYGDGGNVVRCRADGSRVEEVATGFWNPFDLMFDRHGRLLVVDNDPDSRGPNRLVDVVTGGDYGYKSLYGGSGIHPYSAWNGELPGTLAYAAGLGEAPSGMIEAGRTSLPESYDASLLVTIWEERKIVEVKLRPDGASITGESYDLVQGGEDFHPVAFAADSDGTVYFTDWVVRTYPNHGRGRIWRLENSDPVDRMTPPARWSPPVPDRGMALRREIAAIDDVSQEERLLEAMKSDDPFLKAAARPAAARPVFRSKLPAWMRHEDAGVRLQAMLVYASIGAPDESVIASQMLQDPDERIRQAALIWIGEKGLTEAEDAVHDAFEQGFIPASLFDTYLATIRHLQPAFIQAYRAQKEPASKDLERTLPAGFMKALLEDESVSPDIRALAVPYLDNDPSVLPLLKEAIASDSPALQEAALFALMRISSPQSAELVQILAVDETMPGELRADALTALSRQAGSMGAKAVMLAVADTLLANPFASIPEEIRIALVRMLRSVSKQDTDRIHGMLAEQGEVEASSPGPLADQFALWTAERKADASYPHPGTTGAWAQALPTGGDASRGRRIFFSPVAQCSNCHVVNGWGGAIGPDLTNISASKTPDQILKSIVEPSAEIAPEWQGWFVRTEDGQSYFGRQIDVGENSVKLLTIGGEFERYRNVAGYGVSPVSLMPEGLAYQLSLHDMADLLAFLQRTSLSRTDHKP